MRQVLIADHIPARSRPLEGRLTGIPHVPLLLYGVLCLSGGIGMYVVGILLVFPRYCWV